MTTATGARQAPTARLGWPRETGTSLVAKGEPPASVVTVLEKAPQSRADRCKTTSSLPLRSVRWHLGPGPRFAMRAGRSCFRVGCQSVNERVEHGAAPGARPKIFVHHHPGRKVQHERIGEHPDEVGIACSNRDLADADAKAGPEHGKLGKVAVGPQREGGSVHAADPLEHRPDRWCIPVEADHVVLDQVAQRGGHAPPVQVSTMRVKSKRDHSYMLGNQCLLGGLDHSHSDVGISTEQVLNRIREHEFNR
ncbi:protein of unknown function (plasmid) [Azospirillum baldaniorum]|uniref:Uncharacterized protein n=1 Tax=Azospirillum baldaniorum TaxID=1064539 RepID=A0A9P1JV54_9PROT|nr:protein of unknown function [Azospirillum baldaniorum]